MRYNHPKPLREQRSPMYSWCMFKCGGRYVVGNSFIVDDREYVRTDNGEVYDREACTEILCKKIIGEINRQFDFHISIQNARQEHAIDMSGGSAVLSGILRSHMEYTEGCIQPITYQNITLYQVGRNASHSFYLGWQDGQRYVYSIGEGWCSDECSGYDCDECGGVDRDLRAVDTFQGGYYGHL